MEKISPNRQRFFLLYALSLQFVFSPLQAYQTTPPMLATGNYFDGNIRRPLLVQSLDKGTSWQYPPAINETPLPADFMDGDLSKSACNNSVCIATGNYYNNELNPVPLLLQYSENNWSYLDMLNLKTIPADFQKGWFNDSFCKKTHCLAVGLYENSNGSRPLLALQNPDTKKWNYLELVTSNILPTDFKEGWFETISCGKTNCIAAGTYLDNQELRHPLLITSQDDGVTWKSANLKEKITPHSDYSDAFLYASTCENIHCVVTGEYSDPSTPLLMHSDNNGITWNSPAFNLPQDFESGWFVDVDCKASFCIAVGTYYNGEVHRPLLIFSADNGTNWKLQNSEFSKELDNGQYSSASCNKTGCVAGGSSNGSLGMYPLITVSHDKGSTWAYPPSAKSSVPAAELGNGFFRTVNCQEKICIASGDYTVNSVYYPLLALSKDNGNTWEFPESITAPYILPAYFLNGHF